MSCILIINKLCIKFKLERRVYKGSNYLLQNHILQVTCSDLFAGKGLPSDGHTILHETRNLFVCNEFQTLSCVINSGCLLIADLHLRKVSSKLSLFAWLMHRYNLIKKNLRQFQIRKVIDSWTVWKCKRILRCWTSLN